MQGRNWMALAMLAPGSRMTNAGTTTRRLPNRGAAGDIRAVPVQPRRAAGHLGEWASAGSRATARIRSASSSSSRTASTRRWAGRRACRWSRSPGRAPTRLSGSVRGNFRDSRFNAKNPVLDRVVPIDNQQLAFTLGGPILRDKLHFFGHYEYEREPQHEHLEHAVPGLQRRARRQRDDQDGRRTARLSAVAEHAADGEGDRRPSAGSRSPPATTAIPPPPGATAETNREYLRQFTHVLSNRALNEIKVGKTRWIFRNANLTTGATTGSAASASRPARRASRSPVSRLAATTSIRATARRTTGASATTSRSRYDARGRHDLKAGVRLPSIMVDDGNNCQACMGNIDRTRRSTARRCRVRHSSRRWFPDPWNADTWNLAAISPWVRTYSIGVGDYATHDVRPQYQGWLQDDWQFSRESDAQSRRCGTT